MAKRKPTHPQLIEPMAVLPEISSYERIGYAYKVQQKLNAFAYQLTVPAGHRVINDRMENIAWCGDSIGTNMSVRLTPNPNEEMFGYWVEVRFHLEASFNNKASATVWISFGGKYADQKTRLIDGQDMFVYADNFNEVKDECIELVNKTIDSHIKLAA